MFIKPIYKKDVTYYRLVESYRFDNTTRHHTILNLGKLEELPDTEQKRALAIRLNELVAQSHTGVQPLFLFSALGHPE